MTAAIAARLARAPVLAAALALLASATAETRADAAVTFDPPIVSPVPDSTVFDGAVSDFDGDGNSDLAMAAAGLSNALVVSLGDGEGRLGPAQRFPTGSANTARRIALGDFDADGDGDAVVLGDNPDGIDTLHLFLGDGAGGFGLSASVPLGTAIEASQVGPANEIAAGDFDQDGDDDIALTNLGTANRLYLFPANGSGGFGSRIGVDLGSRSDALAAGDLNEDGDVDLVVTWFGTAKVLLGAVGSGFQGPTDTDLAVAGPESVALGDVNGDGHLDLAASPDCPPLNCDERGRLSLLLGDGEGGFSQLAKYGELDRRRLAFADLDADGFDDLIASDLSRGVDILAGSASGALVQAAHPRARFRVGAGGSRAALAGSFGGDQATDLVSPNRGGRGKPATASVLTNTTARGIPETLIDSGPEGRTFRPPVFEFSSDQDAEFECSIDGEDWESCSSGERIPVADGEHTFRVRATNDNGTDPTPDSRTFKLSTRALGTAAFADPASHPVGDEPADVVIADLNGDPRPDLAVANAGSNDVSILLGTGAGGFADPVSYPVGAQPEGVASGDFDDDGDQDIAVANHGSDDVSVLLGDGAGGFEAADDSVPAPEAPTALVPADFDEDGVDDLAIVGERGVADDGSLTVALARGDGSFDVVETRDIGLPLWSVISSDFDRDSDADLVVGGGYPGFLGFGFVLLGDGHGGFGGIHSGVGDDGGRLTGLDAGDLDGDGIEDLVHGAVQSSRTFATFVAFGDGAGHFFQGTIGEDAIALENRAYDLEIGQLTGGTKPDVALIDEPHQLRVFKGDGTGDLLDPQSFSAGTEPEALALGDVSGDGQEDIVLANRGSDDVSVLLSSRSDQTPPDTTITSGPEGPTAENQPRFEFDAGEEATFECSVDGGPFASCASGDRFGPDGAIRGPTAGWAFPHGQHTLAIRATDAAGNVEQVPETRQFFVDSALPDRCAQSGAVIRCAYVETGSEQELTIPETVEQVRVVARGEGGGRAHYRSGTEFDFGTAGLGGWVSASLPVSEGETLYLEVAGVPGAGESGGVTNLPLPPRFFMGGAGGAATSVRSCALADLDCPADDPRLIVAGGGGGGASSSELFLDNSGGDAGGVDEPVAVPGGLVAEGSDGEGPGAEPGAGGRADGPGAGGGGLCPLCTGEDGDGGDGGDGGNGGDSAGGGGGGGYFGGGGGGGSDGSGSGGSGGGGGGSSFGPPGARFGITRLPASIVISFPDTIPPGTTIDSGPPADTVATSSSAAFTYSGVPAPDADRFECSLDDAGWSDCPAAGQSYEGLADGQHTFAVRALDAAGNADPTPAERTWTVDATPPDTRIDSGPDRDSVTRQSDAAFTYSGDPEEDTEGFECSLDRAPFSACDAGGAAYEGLADGIHRFAVRAVDAAGNADASPAVVRWRVAREGISCGGRDASILGTLGDDRITGTPRSDAIRAFAGADVVRAGGGDDRACGSPGADRLHGGSGDDLLKGGRGPDFISGGPGNDRCFGGPGKDEFAPTCETRRQ